jgi:hypothetical protein
MSVTYHVEASVRNAEQRFTKLISGTNHVDSNSPLCMASVAAGMRLSLGPDGPPVAVAGVVRADLVGDHGTQPRARGGSVVGGGSVLSSSYAAAVLGAIELAPRLDRRRARLRASRQRRCAGCGQRHGRFGRGLLSSGMCATAFMFHGMHRIVRVLPVR